MHGMGHQLLKTCQEGQLNFDPTYKYDIGTSNYDTSANLRVPAWTDRVIFSQTHPTLSLLKYGRADITLSDHMPVYAQFKTKVRKVNEEAKALIEESLLQKFAVIKHNQSLSTAPQQFNKVGSGSLVFPQEEKKVATNQPKLLTATSTELDSPIKKPNENKQTGPINKVEPVVGDPGVLATENEKTIHLTEEQKKDIQKEKTNLNIKENELQEIIHRNSVELTEEQVKQIE